MIRSFYFWILSLFKQNWVLRYNGEFSYELIAVLPFAHWLASKGKEELGAWKNGKKHGLWTTYYANQQIKDIGTYENGVYNGKWTFYYENGEKEKEGTLKNGNAHDKWIFYNDKGKNFFCFIESGILG